MVDRTALGIYLNDHLAGSVTGLEAMDRLSDTSQHTSLGRAIDVLRHRAKNYRSWPPSAASLARDSTFPAW